MSKKTKKPEDLDRLCWHCNTKLLYGGEHDISQEDEFYDSVTYMGCPDCGTHVETVSYTHLTLPTTSRV